MNHKAVCTLYIANVYHHTPILLDPIESLNTGYIVIDSSTPSSQIYPHFPDLTSYEHVQVFTLIWRPPRAYFGVLENTAKMGLIMFFLTY